MMKLGTKWLALGALMAGTLMACGGEEGSDDAPAVTDGDYHHYVTSSIKVPQTRNEADGLAFDLDGDGMKENVVGRLFASLTASGISDLQGPITTAVNAGDLVVLHSVRANSLAADTTVSWQVFLGDPQAAPVLTGGGTFSVSARSPADAKVIGAIADGKFATGWPSTITLQVAVLEGQPPLSIRLVGSQVAGDVTATDVVNGRIGGALTKTELDTVVLPALASLMDATVKAECPSQNECSERAKSILGFFDKNGDRSVSEEEVRTNTTLQAALTPDVDMLDGDGNVDVGADGTKDSISLSLGFSAKTAVFTAPGE